MIEFISRSAEWLLSWGPVLSGIGSLILTLGLVYLYRIQTNIQETQKELSKSQHRSHIRVEDYRLLSVNDLARVFNSGFVQGDPGPPCAGLFISLSNFGKGPADSLRGELYFKSDDRKYGITSILDHGSDFGTLAFSDKGGVIGPEERRIPFYCRFAIPKIDQIPEEWRIHLENENIESELLEPVAPTDLMRAIAAAGDRFIEVGMKIHYEDGTGKREPDTLFIAEVDLAECEDFRSVIEVGSPVFDQNFQLKYD